MKKIWIIWLVFFLVACGDDDEKNPASLGKTTNLLLDDVSNQGNSSDLEISFNAPLDESNINEYRIFLVKESDAPSFDATTASSVPAGNYFSVDVDSETIALAFPANQKDHVGNLIETETSYRAFVLSVGSGAEGTLSTASNTEQIAQNNLVQTLTDAIQGGSGGLAVDKQGNIYFADFGASLNGPPGDKVFKITPSGEVSIFATGLIGASGNAFDSKGNLFQSNISGGKISKISPDGTVSDFVSDGIQAPVGIAIDADDNLFVANCGNNTLRKVTPDGVSTPFSASPLFNCPNGITRDTEGNLYVANFSDGNVIKVTPNGTATLFATITGGNNGHISFVNDALYVVARAANQIYKIDLEGNVSLVAGTGVRGLRDGSAKRATLSLTNDVVADPTGKILYFNDVVNPTNNSDLTPVVIRKILLEE